MIERDHGEITIVCDECGSEEHGGVLEWDDFWAEKKADGWKARKDGDVWSHACPDCVEGR